MKTQQENVSFLEGLEPGVSKGSVDLGAANNVQSMQHLVGRILGVVNGKTSARGVKKELQSSAERLMELSSKLSNDMLFFRSFR